MKALEDTKSEKRITFNLYDCWNAIAVEGQIPSLKQMNKKDISTFKDNLVLLDLRSESTSPILHIIGQNLLSDLDHDITGLALNEVPRRTMLSRITDHYLEVIANSVPIAFEAEFVNIHHEKALYRGILLPFSDDNENINFILGGIRWLLVNDISVNDNEPSIDDLINQISDDHTAEPLDVSDQESEVALEDEIEDEQLYVSHDDLGETKKYSLKDLMQEVAGGRKDATSVEEELSFDEDEMLSAETDHYETDSNDMLSLEDDSEQLTKVSSEAKEEYTFASVLQKFANLSVEITDINEQSSTIDDAIDEDMVPVEPEAIVIRHFHPQNTDHEDIDDSEITQSDLTDAHEDIAFENKDDAVLDLEPTHDDEVQNISDSIEESDINVDSNETEDISSQLNQISKQFDNDTSVHTDDLEDAVELTDDFSEPHIAKKAQSFSLEGQAFPTEDQEPTIEELMRAAIEHFQNLDEESSEPSVETYDSEEDNADDPAGTDDHQTKELELVQEIQIEEENTLSQNKDELSDDDSNLELSDGISEEPEEEQVKDIIENETKETYEAETSLEDSDDKNGSEKELLENDPSAESFEESNVDEDNSSKTARALSEEEIKFYTELQTIPAEPTYLAEDFDENATSESVPVPELSISAEEGADQTIDLTDNEATTDNSLLNKTVQPESAEVETKCSVPQSLEKRLEQVIKYIEKEDQNHNRSRDSLYNILPAIYGFYEHCENLPDEFQEILNKSNLKIQARAPYTPVLKLCLGHDYDKTRLTEYSAAMWLAHETGISKNDFQSYIRNFPGGIKGCVKEARTYKKTGRPSRTALGETLSINEIRDVIRKMPPMVRFRLNQEMATTNDEEFCLLLAKYVGQDISILQIVDDNSLKLESILKRIAIAHKKVAPTTRRITIRRK